VENFASQNSPQKTSKLLDKKKKNDYNSFKSMWRLDMVAKILIIVDSSGIAIIKYFVNGVWVTKSSIVKGDGFIMIIPVQI